MDPTIRQANHPGKSRDAKRREDKKAPGGFSSTRGFREGVMTRIDGKASCLIHG
jgi:hypothetical protein